MQHICLDLNVILDVLLKRELFFESSYRIMKLIEQGKIVGYISAHHIDTLVYIIRKNGIPFSQTRNIIQELCRGLQVLSVDEIVIHHAIADEKFTDIEDAILYHACLEADIDIIVTRNSKDFPYFDNLLQIMIPDELVL